MTTKHNLLYACVVQELHWTALRHAWVEDCDGYLSAKLWVLRGWEQIHHQDSRSHPEIKGRTLAQAQRGHSSKVEAGRFCETSICLFIWTIGNMSFWISLKLQVEQWCYVIQGVRRLRVRYPCGMCVWLSRNYFLPVVYFYFFLNFIIKQVAAQWLKCTIRHVVDNCIA